MKIKINKEIKEVPKFNFRAYGEIINHSEGQFIVEKDFVIEWIGRTRLTKFEKQEVIDELVKVGLLKRLSKSNKSKYEINRVKVKEVPKDYYGNPLW